MGVSGQFGSQRRMVPKGSSESWQDHGHEFRHFIPHLLWTRPSPPTSPWVQLQSEGLPLPSLSDWFTVGHSITL